MQPHTAHSSSSAHNAHTPKMSDDWEESGEEGEYGGFGALTLDETPDGGDKVWSDEDDDGEVVGAAPAVPKQAKKQVRAVPKAKDLKAQKIAEMRAKEKAKAAERAARRARLNPNMDEAALQRKGNCSLELFSLYHMTEYFTNIMIF